MNLKQWLEPNPLKKIQTKLNIFPEDCLNIFEFRNPVENEQELAKKYYVEPAIEKIEDDEKMKDKKKDAKQAPPKKDPKKDAKKIPLKKGEKEPEKKIIPLLDWPKDEREKIFADKDEILPCIKDLSLAISIEII